MPVPTSGLHHVTAIVGDPQRNVDFYTGVLGLRLVKRTVNFDDPATYHFYYGDTAGQPGTLFTCFPWPTGTRGRIGTGQIAAIAFAISPSSIGYWIERLLAHGIAFEGPARRFDEPVLAFKDPDGLLLELIGTARAALVPGWSGGAVPDEHAVRGLHGVTIWEDGDRGSAGFLEAALGMSLVGNEETRVRYASGSAALGAIVDLRRVPGFWAGAEGVGTVHHVAFRSASGDQQLDTQERIRGLGGTTTEVIDRQYFRSVYFREPGGVLYELATDGPGFTIDEPLAELGATLKLPPWLEPERQRIEGRLPPLRAPAPPRAQL